MNRRSSFGIISAALCGFDYPLRKDPGGPVCRVTPEVYNALREFTHFTEERSLTDGCVRGHLGNVTFLLGSNSAPVKVCPDSHVILTIVTNSDSLRSHLDKDTRELIMWCKTDFALETSFAAPPHPSILDSYTLPARISIDEGLKEHFAKMANAGKFDAQLEGL